MSSIPGLVGAGLGRAVRGAGGGWAADAGEASSPEGLWRPRDGTALARKDVLHRGPAGPPRPRETESQGTGPRGSPRDGEASLGGAGPLGCPVAVRGGMPDSTGHGEGREGPPFLDR